MCSCILAVQDAARRRQILQCERMRILPWVVVVAGVVAAAVFGAGRLGFLAGPAPNHLGVTNGRLKPPSKNPNSVSSQAGLFPGHPQQSYAAIEPLKFQGDSAAAMQRLAGLLAKQTGTSIVESRPDYLYAQCSTRWLRFTDDVEFWLDKPAAVIQLRSASRLGRKDFGANRARMETLRAQFGR